MLPRSVFLCQVHGWRDLALLEVLVEGVNGDLGEGDDHGEDHPDVEHLDVRGHW